MASKTQFCSVTLFKRLLSSWIFLAFIQCQFVEKTTVKLTEFFGNKSSYNNDIIVDFKIAVKETNGVTVPAQGALIRVLWPSSGKSLPTAPLHRVNEKGSLTLTFAAPFPRGFWVTLPVNAQGRVVLPRYVPFAPGGAVALQRALVGVELKEWAPPPSPAHAPDLEVPWAAAEASSPSTPWQEEDVATGEPKAPVQKNAFPMGQRDVAGVQSTPAPELPSKPVPVAEPTRDVGAKAHHPSPPLSQATPPQTGERRVRVTTKDGTPLAQADIWVGRSAAGTWRFWGKTDTQGLIVEPQGSLLGADTVFARHTCCGEAVLAILGNEGRNLNLILEEGKPRISRVIYTHYGVEKAIEGAALVRGQNRVDVARSLGFIKDESILSSSTPSESYFVDIPGQGRRLPVVWGKDILAEPKVRPKPVVGIWQEDQVSVWGSEGRFLRQLLVSLLRNSEVRVRQAPEVKQLVSGALGQEGRGEDWKAGWQHTSLLGEFDFLLEIRSLKKDNSSVIELVLKGANGAQVWSGERDAKGSAPEAQGRQLATELAQAIPREKVLWAQVDGGLR